jgi:hypothetical protein
LSSRDLTYIPVPRGRQPGGAVGLTAVFEKTIPGQEVDYHRTPLWNNGWWLAGIFGLLILEWVIRRMKGLA